MCQNTRQMMLPCLISTFQTRENNHFKHLDYNAFKTFPKWSRLASLRSSVLSCSFLIMIKIVQEQKSRKNIMKTKNVSKIDHQNIMQLPSLFIHNYSMYIQPDQLLFLRFVRQSESQIISHFIRFLLNRFLKYLRKREVPLVL